MHLSRIFRLFVLRYTYLARILVKAAALALLVLLGVGLSCCTEVSGGCVFSHHRLCSSEHLPMLLGAGGKRTISPAQAR